MQSSTKEKTKDVILSFYDVAEIAEAKNRLYTDHKETVGKPPSRRGSSRRSEEEADMMDIIEALDKLDKSGVIPEYLARNGNRVPLILPEAQNEHQTCSINMQSIERRVAQLELAMSEKQATPNLGRSYSEAANYSSMPRSGTHVMQFSPSATLMQKSIRERSEKENIISSDRSAYDPRSRQTTHRGIRDSVRGGDNHRSRAVVAIGTGGNQRIGDSGLKGAPPPKRDFFVYRVDKGETKERVIDHLKCLGVDAINIERTSHEDAKFASFRLTTNREFLDVVMNPDNWPEGIRVRPFYQKRIASFQNNDNHDPFEEFRTVREQETDIDCASVSERDENDIRVAQSLD